MTAALSLNVQITECGTQLDDAARFKARYLGAKPGHEDPRDLQSWYSYAHSALSDINTLLLSDGPSTEQRRALSDYQVTALEMQLDALNRLRT